MQTWGPEDQDGEGAAMRINLKSAYLQFNVEKKMVAVNLQVLKVDSTV